MKKRANKKTAMQDPKLRHECSATWGGNRQKVDGVAFRVTSPAAKSSSHDAGMSQPWPLTAEEEELFCG